MAGNDVSHDADDNVELKVPKILTAKPWYSKEDEPKAKKDASEWQAKRDAWDKYDSNEYKNIIENFDASRATKKAKVDTSERIYDAYSRSMSQPSYRDVKDTAHYLLDVGNTDSFDDAGVLKETEPTTVDGPEKIDEPPPPTSSGLVEDHYPNNHTSIYGSWFSKGRWGYSCCHQLDPGSTCTKN